MATPPPCKSLGSQCRELRLTFRIAELDEDDAEFHDHLGTWLLGHTERITFGRPYVGNRRLLVDGTVHVGCKYLRDADGQGAPGRPAGNAPARVRCEAHGFSGIIPAESHPARRALQHGNGQYTIVQDGRVQMLTLAASPSPRHSLPTLQPENPCTGAPCRTADNTRGTACCRDLTAEVVMQENHGETEALLRSRTPPYVCKVTLASEDILECEMISACGYLAGDDLSCSLHGLERRGGGAAKPSICSDWPAVDPDSEYHPGCRLIPVAR
ncbi:MAG: hypothetical protein HY700_05325 [Gemmatimonadetes bacterium]|nr:hypothetical protein [Gemmatimonadota bacterium]